MGAPGMIPHFGMGPPFLMPGGYGFGPPPGFFMQPPPGGVRSPAPAAGPRVVPGGGPTAASAAGRCSRQRDSTAARSSRGCASGRVRSS